MKTLEATHVLARILEAGRQRLADAKIRVPEAVVRKMSSVAPACASFEAALEAPDRTRIIAEIKKASPSAGVLAADLDPRAQAAAYAAAGASAISVVTEPDFFQGDLAWIRIAADVSGLPVLRKDFVFDPYQVFETRAAGASAVLLIAAMLDGSEMLALIRTAEEQGLDVLVEVHDEAELDEALAAGASIIGVNNRNLKTFEVSLDPSLRLAERIPADVIFVAESGIHGRADLERLAAAGADAFLVGERLIRSGDPGAALKELL